MNSTETKKLPARAGLPIEEIERLAKLQRESRAIRERVAAEVRAEKRQPAMLCDTAMRGLLAAGQDVPPPSRQDAKEGSAEANATRVSYLGEWSPLFRWFASMCGVASAGMVAMALLGSATPDAVIIVTLAACLEEP